MITTKGQRKKLYRAHVGYGFIAFKSWDDQITEVEFYVAKDNSLRKVGTGEPLLPLDVQDEDEYTNDNFE